MFGKIKRIPMMVQGVVFYFTVLLLSGWAMDIVEGPQQPPDKYGKLPAHQKRAKLRREVYRSSEVEEGDPNTNLTDSLISSLHGLSVLRQELNALKTNSRA